MSPAIEPAGLSRPRIEPLARLADPALRWLSLGALADITVGTSAMNLTRASETADGPPVLTPAQLMSDGSVSHEGVRRVPKRDAEKLDRFRLRPGDVVCVRQGAPGRAALIRRSEAGWIAGSGCMRLEVIEPSLLTREYLVFYLGHPAVRDWQTGQASGHAVLTLTEYRLSMLPVLLPPLERQLALAVVAEALDEQIRRHDHAKALLAELRSAVTDRMLGGGE